jgi:glycosyltransferase involved in cell wall biosynthesis
MSKEKRRFSIISISSNLPWSNMPKRNQMMMSYLSRLESIDRVIFVNPDLWLFQLIEGLREKLSPANHKLYRFTLKSVVPKRVEDKIYTITPFYFIPFLGKSIILRNFQTRIQYQIIKSFLNTKDYILFLNDFNSETNHKKLVNKFLKKASLTVYDWSDDFVEFFKDEKGRKAVRQTCEKYLKSVDVVFTVNAELGLRAKEHNPHSYTVLNATDYDNMSRACGDGLEIPRVLKTLSRPLIGYIGWIVAVRMDSEILKYVAKQHQESTVVLVGPVGQRFIKLFNGIKNIKFLPPVDYKEIPRYLKYFDVCLIPHQDNNHTRGNNPIKVFDYLAAGKPVVSTPVAGVEPFKDLIYIASSPKEFSDMVGKALSEGKSNLKNKRLKAAKKNSWAVRVEEVWNILNRHMNA